MTITVWRSILTAVLAFNVSHGRAEDMEVPASSAINVEDLSRFASIGDPQTLDGRDFGGEPGIPSPDGKYVAVLVRAGNPELRANEARLLVYRKDTLLAGAEPQLLAQFSSTGNYQPIAFVRWLEDSKSLTFAGTKGDEPSQVFRVSLDTPGLQQLTKLSTQLLSYEASPSGERIVTVTAQPAARPENDPACLREACRVTVDRLLDAEEGRALGSRSFAAHDVRAGWDRPLDSPQSVDEAIDYCDSKLIGGLAPNGRFAVVACRLREEQLPGWWQEYSASSAMRRCRQLNNFSCYRRGMLFDLERRTTVALSDSPLMGIPAWIEGGRQLVLGGSLESLAGVDAAERSRRASSFAITAINPVTHEITRVASLPVDSRVSSISWDEARGVLSATIENAQGVASLLQYRRAGAGWIAVSPVVEVRKQPLGGVRLVLEQSLNEPPKLIARDNVGNASRMVLDPNPWLKQRKLGRVEEVTWTARNGRVWRGGLYYPTSFNSRTQYPLVIQTHGFDPKRFSLHGRARAFPGQALVSHGFVVLQVEENYADVAGGAAEWSAVQLGYEAAVDYLASEGLIDRSRVGVLGWSRTGSHLAYFLTHSSYPIAASVFVNTVDLGWLWYTADGTPKIGDATYGAPPFGEGLGAWFEQAPTFNLDRVGAPLLMWQELAVWTMWDWYAGLRRLNKPVEYVFSPKLAHDVFDVGQRIEGNHLIVDWFRFWLQGAADAVPEKADQYLRWRQLEQLQQASRSNNQSLTP